MIDLVKRELLIRALHIGRYFYRLPQHVLIDRLHLLERDRIFYGIKSIEISKNEAKRVANVAIDSRHPLHDLRRARDIFAKVDRRDPHAHDFATERVRDLDRIDSVAERLRHGAALFVERPSAGCDHAIGSAAFVADGAEQGRMEPSAVLVAAFEIQIGGPGQVRLVTKDSGVARSRLEPHVENVGFLFKLRAAAVRTFVPVRKNRIRLRRVPRIGAVL